MKKDSASCGNVFRDIGFDHIEAERLRLKSDLIIVLARTMRLRGLSQKHAAQICETDQPTLSKIMRGKLSSVTIDKLCTWLARLGCDIQLIVKGNLR